MLLLLRGSKASARKACVTPSRLASRRCITRGLSALLPCFQHDVAETWRQYTTGLIGIECIVINHAFFAAVVIFTMLRVIILHFAHYQHAQDCRLQHSHRYRQERYPRSAIRCHDQSHDLTAKCQRVIFMMTESGSSAQRLFKVRLMCASTNVGSRSLAPMCACSMTACRQSARSKDFRPIIGSLNCMRRRSRCPLFSLMGLLQVPRSSFRSH